jgi:FSR family fosmidomycin resistance protein-like MFS transporter
MAGTVGGLIAGHVSDRIGFKPVFIFTHVLMAPVLIMFLNLPGYWAHVGALIAGAMVLATMPLGVVMAQTLAPKSRSMVASLMMGFAFGLGGTMSPIVGKLADLYTIETVLMGISLIPLLTLPLVFSFPRI